MKSKIAWLQVFIYTLITMLLDFLFLPIVFQKWGPIIGGRYLSEKPLFLSGLGRVDLLLKTNPLFLSASIFMILGLAVWLAVDSDSSSATGGDVKDAETTEHGSARWQTKEERDAKYKSYIQKTNGVSDVQTNKNGDFGGIVINSEPIDSKIDTTSSDYDPKKAGYGPAKIWYSDAQEHNVIIGTTGSGKTTNFIQPSIKSIRHAKGSMIITDPKGELYVQNKKILQDAGYDVLLLNYDNPSAGMSFNQLEFINKQYDEGLPYYYKYQAYNVIQKYINFLNGDNSAALKEVDNFNDDDIFTPVKLKEIRTNYDLSLLREYLESNECGDKVTGIIEFLKAAFTSMEKRIKESADDPKCNEYVVFKQEHVLKACLDILNTLTKENVVNFYDDRAKYFRDYAIENSNSLSLATEANSKADTYESISRELKETDTFNLEHLSEFIRDSAKESKITFDTYEQLAMKEAQSLSGMVVSASQNNGGAKGEAIWIETPKALLTALILLVSRESHLTNSRHMSSIFRILSELSDVKPASKPGQNPRQETWLDDILNSFEADDVIKLSQTAMRVAGGNTKSSIMVSAIPAIQVWADSRVASQSLSTSFTFQGIVEKPTAIFLNIPGKDTSPTYTILGSLFIEEIYAALVDVANKKYNGGLPRPVYFLLDEFGNMPPIPELDSKVSLARSRNIKFNFIIQSLQQFDSNYKAIRETIMSNCNLLYLLTNDYQTAEYVSKRLGTKTIENESVNTSTSKDGETSTSRSVHRQKRELMLPGELMDSFSKNAGIYIHPREFPLQVKYVPSYGMPDFPEITSNPATDLNSERPYQDINAFIPGLKRNGEKEPKAYVKAYKLSKQFALLDKEFDAALKRWSNAQNIQS